MQGRLSIGEQQKERMEQILTLQLTDGDVESQKIISAFVDEYMGAKLIWKVQMTARLAKIT